MLFVRRGKPHPRTEFDHAPPISFRVPITPQLYMFNPIKIQPAYYLSLFLLNYVGDTSLNMDFFSLRICLIWEKEICVFNRLAQILNVRIWRTIFFV